MSVESTLEGLKAKRARIDEAISVLENLGVSLDEETATVRPHRSRRNMSAEGRARISRAAKRRWAEWRKSHTAAA